MRVAAVWYFRIWAFLCFLLAFAGPVAAELTIVVPSAVTPGQPFFVELSSDTAPGDVFIDWNGGAIPMEMQQADTNGPWRGAALLGVPYGSKGKALALLVTSVAADGHTVYTRSLPLQMKKYPEQQLKVAGKYVELAKKDLDRHNTERVDVKKILTHVGGLRRWEAPFLRPVPGDVSSAYGMTRIFNGKPRKPHMGLDLRGAAGTAVHATASGVVVLAAEHFFSGNSVYIDHGQGVVSMYFHLSRIDVQAGQSVRRGEIIGAVGSTGRVTGPHLHFGIAAQGVSVDPVPLLADK